MKQRQLIWLGAALVILILVAFLAGTFDSEISTVKVPDVRIPADRVHGIRVERPDMRLALVRSDGLWRLTEPVDAPADSMDISRFLEDVSAMRLASVVSTSPERYGRYGVDSTGATVTLEWDGGARTFVVSNDGPSFDTNYIRLEDDASVYATVGGIRLPSDADAWRDETIVKVEPQSVATVSIEGPDLSYEIRREDTGWILAEGSTTTAADSASTMRYLSRFSPLSGNGFLEDAPAESDSTYRVRISLMDGAQRTLILSPSGTDDMAVTVDGGETVYRLRKLRLPQVTPEVSYFTSP